MEFRRQKPVTRLCDFDERPVKCPAGESGNGTERTGLSSDEGRVHIGESIRDPGTPR